MHTCYQFLLLFQVTDSNLVRLLFYEQKEMVIDGRYPLDLEQCVYLAGIQCLVNFGEFHPFTHTPEFYKYIFMLQSIIILLPFEHSL